MNHLVLFDVDRTLLAGNTVHEVAFAYAFRTVFETEASIKEINHHGMTDSGLLYAIMRLHGVADEDIRHKLDETFDVMIEYFREHVDESDSTVLPGVREVLAALHDRGVVVGLVTGNVEPIGWMKMKHHGLYQYFSGIGGFGNDHEERSELVKVAIKRAEELPGGDFQRGPANVYHIGDAPSDLLAAHQAGVRGIGVATGIYTSADLMEHPHHAILPDLVDLPRFLGSVGL